MYLALLVPALGTAARGVPDAVRVAGLRPLDHADLVLPEGEV